MATLLMTITLTALTTACSGGHHADDPLAGASSEEAASARAVPQTPEPTKPGGPGSPPVSTVAPPPRGGPAPLAPATQDPPPPPRDVAPCRTANLTVRVIRQTGGGPNEPAFGLVALTNTTSHACGLSGWPTVGLTTGGQALRLSSTNVDRPRPPVAVTLEPRRSAFAGVRWRVCAPPATGCRTGDGFRVAAPGSTATQAELVGFPDPEKALTISALEIGTVQPTTTDIINW